MRLLVRRKVTFDAIPPQRLYELRHSRVWLNHRPRCERVLEGPLATPFDQETRQRVDEAEATFPRWSFNPRHGGNELVDVALGAEQALP